MEASYPDKWTVSQENSLLQDEEAFDREIVIHSELLRLQMHEPTYEPIFWINVELDIYLSKKQAEMLSKIKNKFLYNKLTFFRFTNKQDEIIDMLLNHDGRQLKKLKLAGLDESVSLSKPLVHALWLTWSQASVEMNTILDWLKLPHKQFWRIFFSMWHTKSIDISFCNLYDIKSIEGRFWVDTFAKTEISITWSKFIKDYQLAYNTDDIVPLIMTIARLQEMGPKWKEALKLDFSETMLIKDEIIDYVRCQGLSDTIKLWFQ